MARQRADRKGLLERTARTFPQKRAAATYEALLTAAEKVFAARGFERAQTPEIAAEAGVSTGAFYRYFTDKRQVFVEMIARNLKRAHEDVMQRLDPTLFDGKNRRGVIDRALDVLFEHVKRDEQLARVYLSMSLRDPEVEALRTEFEAMGLESLTLLVRALVPKKRLPNPRAAALVIQLAALEVAGERAGLRPRIAPSLSERDLKHALREMIHAYLFARDE